MLPDVLLISTHLWKRLSKTEQAWLQEAAEHSVAHQRELWANSEREALEAVQKAGVRISYPDKAPFKEAVQGIYKQYANDPEMAELISRIQNTK